MCADEEEVVVLKEVTKEDVLTFFKVGTHARTHAHTHTHTHTHTTYYTGPLLSGWSVSEETSGTRCSYQEN